MRRYGQFEKDMFAVAYNWMFGESIYRAKEVYKTMTEEGNQSYIDTVIEAYCRNFKIAFQQD